MCGKVCVKCGQMVTFMLVLSTFVLLVMVYFMPSAITSIITSNNNSSQQPSFSNPWFNPPSDNSWLPTNFQTWTSQSTSGQEDMNQTIIEGNFC